MHRNDAASIAVRATLESDAKCGLLSLLSVGRRPFQAWASAPGTLIERSEPEAFAAVRPQPLR